MECFTTSFRFAYLELWREREGRERVVQKKGILTYPSCSGLFCFFLLWIAFLSSLSLSPSTSVLF